VPYDGNDPAYEDLYLPNRGAKGLDQGMWYTDQAWWHQKWFGYVKELIDVYHPDLLYSDGGVPFGQYGLDIIAHLYNTSAGRNNGLNQAVYTQKDKNVDVLSVGIYDIERSQTPDIFPFVWQTDTSMGDWFYNAIDVYKTPKQVAEMLVDIVSKNGNLLLNIPQRPDGTHDDEGIYLLERTGAWLKVVGDGIYDTRPWVKASEGPSSVVIEGFREESVPWTIEDFRFTQKGKHLYAFLMKWPEGGKSVVRSFDLETVGRIGAVELLGAPPIPWSQSERGLAVDLPVEKPCEYAQCLRVTLE
jgi:alpha-L-fucosidase